MIERRRGPSDEDEPLELFPLGQVVATPGALEAFQNANEAPFPYINRHAVGDWGDLYPEDKRSNDEALEMGYRILSAYTLSSGMKIWIITEADRSVTTLLLPEEY